MAHEVTKVRSEQEPRSSSGLVVPPVLRERVACPNCLGNIDFHSDSGSCSACGAIYPFTPDGQVDLRLHAVKRYRIEFEVGSGDAPETHASFEPIPFNPQ